MSRPLLVAPWNARTTGDDCADVAVRERRESRRTGAARGEDAVGADAAADVENAISLAHVHDLDQGAGAVVELPVRKDTGPAQEAHGGALIGTDLVNDFVS